MDGTFMDFWKSKARDSLRLLLNVSCEINLNRKDKYVVLSKLSILLYMKNKKMSYKNSRFWVSAPTWDEEFELSDGS